MEWSITNTMKNAITVLLSRWSKFYSGTFFSVAVLFVVPCLCLVKKWRKLSMASLPPGPRGVPVLGYLPFLGPVAHLHQRMADLAATHGPIYKLWLGSNNLWVVVSSPSLVREMIHPDRDHIFMNRSPPISASIMAYQKSGVFTSQGTYWREVRKIFAGKMLSNANVDGCYDIRRQVVHKAIRDVYGRSIGVPIDVDELLYLTVTDAVISMVVGGGGRGAVIEGIPDKFREVLDELITLPSKLNVSDMFPALAWLDIQGIAKRAKKASSRSDQMLDALIKQRIEQGNKRQGLSKDFLHVLLELKQNEGDGNATSFTMIQLKALLQDAIIGGTDAPAQSAIWVMRELMKHPKAMEKVKSELAEVVGEDGIVEELHLPNLHYLDAVIKETLRLHPPIPLLIPRTPKEPCMIGGYTIPKGAQVFLNAWSIHRDPLVWDNPLEFRPERFLDDSCKIDYLGNNPKYFPFGSGKRMCAGLSLARKMLPYVIASFLHALEWKLPYGVEEIDFSAKYEVLLKSKEPLIVVPTPKQHQMDLYLHSY